MSVSPSRLSGLSRNRKQVVENASARQKARRPQARRAFFEVLETRSMMAIDVAVIGGTANTSGYAAIVNQLNDDTYFDFNATLLTEAQADTVGELNAFDVVVIGNSGIGGVNYSLFESALRSYVESGRGVVSTGWIVDWTSEAGNPDLEDVVPVDLGSTLFAFAGTVTITDGTHPVTTGVTDFSILDYIEGSVLGASPGSTTLATTAYNFPSATVSSSVVLGNPGAGRSVYLGPIYSAATELYDNDDLRSGMADRLFEQSVAWAAGVTNAGTLTPTLSGGNLVITDTDATGKDNSLTISNNGLAGPLAALVITDANEAFTSTGGIAGATLSNGNKTLTVPLTSITGTSVIINGGAGNDTLTASVANALGKILTFNGDDPTAGTGDKLVVTGGAHATGMLNHTNKSDGSVVLGANTINYTGLEPVDITGTTITNLVINLPDNAVTPDNTELSLTGGGTILTVTSLNASHETDNIALAAFATVTVNARNGNDTIRIDSTMSSFNKALILNGGSGDDTFVFETSVSAPGTITVNGNPGNDTLDYSGYQVAAVDTAVDVTLTAPGANGYSGNVKVGATTITSFTEIDSVIGNSSKTTDSLTGLNSGATWNINEPALSTYSTGNPLGFQNLEKLNGGTNFDHFTINNTGAVAFTLAGGAGTDQLNVDPLGAATVTLTGDGTPAGFDGTFGTSNFTSLDGFYGAPSAALVGDDVNATWTILNGGTSTYVTATRSASFGGFGNLQGGAGQDTFDVVNNSLTANYSLKGGAGLDAFNFGNANNLANITQPVSVDGEDDGATLTLNDQGTNVNVNYTITATTIGRVGGGTITFDDITDLTLNATNGTNKLSVTAVPTASGTKTLNGGTGADTLDLTGFGVSSVEITNNNATAGFDGNFAGVNFTSVDSFQGVNGSTFKGDDQISIWTINDGGTSTYATATRTANISGFNILQGNSAKDTFNVVNNSSTANYSLKGGAGVDAFNFGNANNLANIANPISVDGEADSATLTLNDQGTATSVNYTAGANTIGRDGGGTVTYSNVTDLTLNATNGTNTIKITAVPTATGAVKFNGGTGDDVLDTTGLAANVVVTAPNATKGFDGTIAGAGSFTGIESFKGNNASSFLGDDEISIWTLNDTSGSTYVSQLRTGIISGFSTLQGGSKADTFNVQDNSGALAYTLKGGAGLDAFNFGASNKLDGITKPINVDGEGDSANLVLNDQGNGTLANFDYTLGANTIGRDGGGTVTYSAITNLTLNASNGSNKIKVTAAPTATGAKTVNGGTGNDVLDLSLLPSSKVTLTGLTPVPATTGFDGNIDGVANFTGVEEIKASTAGTADELIGLNAASTWVINDATGSTYATTRTLKWSAFENLTGNAAVDTYKLQNNSSSNTLTLDGKAGGDKFLIGDTVNKLVNLQNLNVIGGADAGDELTLNDQAETAANDYTITATTAADDGGVVVTHSTVEKITLNASKGLNAVKVIDGAYNPSTTIKVVDATGASTLAVDDTADTSGNNWTVTNAQVARTAPAPTLTIDYSTQTTITNLTLSGGKAVDNVTVNSTKVATTIQGNEDNDVFAVGNGDLDNFAGQLTIDGGGNGAGTRTVFRGGSISNTIPPVFTAASDSTIEKGDKLTVSDSLQAGVTKYAVNSTTVSRTGAAKSVTYANIEELSLLAGNAESDVIVTVPPTTPVGTTQLPAIVSIDGGNSAKDNRVQVKGSTLADEITVGNATNVETNRSQIEVTSVSRLWIEGNKGADVLHNRSTVPGLIDGGYQKTSNANEANLAVTDDIIISDAPSTTTFSPVLLGNDGKDILYTTNGSASGTTYLVGDYFINNNVPLIQGSASKTSRLQVVAGGGQAGDRYVTAHTPATNLRNRVLARLDAANDSYSGRFANLTADTIGSSLGVIEWLRGRLPLTISTSGMASELSRINYNVRLFTREPGSAAAPSYPNQTYNPGGAKSGGSYNGGEFIEDDSSSTEVVPLVQNPFNPADVNGDGRLTAFDALLIINELNRNGAHQLDTSPNGEFGVNGGGENNRPIDFLDVNGDSAVSAFDALIVINQLNLNGVTTFAQPDSFAWFQESDAAEQAAADWAASQVAESQSQASSVTDEALLALLAAGDADGDQE